ncbi:LmbU family transcriptional regulator [Streptomyces sp. NPDC093510]|uniref:LmbU family transcriptional regulator n=1 Tax=Streptomyces sp. NPDC093510 TaxID=3155199 RepID=UPI00342FD2F8
MTEASKKAMAYGGRTVREENSIRVTRVGMEIPEVLAYSKWEHAGQRLSGIATSSSWCLGDWLLYGQRAYTDRYHRAIEAAGLDYQTLRNYAWVARRFEIDRRWEALSFQHHAEVAALPAEEQDRWLGHATEQGWSRNKLRESIRLARESDAGPGGLGTSAVLLPRLSVEARLAARWREAAEEAGCSLSDWIVDTLDRCATQLLSGQEPDKPRPSAILPG